MILILFGELSNRITCRVVPEQFPQPGLKSCNAFGLFGNTCKRCGCSWEHHLHINFTQVKKPKVFKNTLIESTLFEKKDAFGAQQRMIEDCKQKLTELLNEQDVIKSISIRFATYLKQNAILPYNDLFEKYAELCIKNEQKCVRQGKSTKLENLKRCLAEYLKDRDTILHAIDAGDKSVEEISFEEIEACQQQLFQLKHSGNNLKQLYDATLALNEHYKEEKEELRKPKVWRIPGKKK